MRFAKLELYLAVLDEGEPRERWTGDPMASKETDEALREELDAMTERLKARGITPARTSYGITAFDA